MSERPDLFPPVYVGMIRAGEVGGILDETVQRLKKVLAREWTLANRHPAQEAPLFLLLPAGKSLPEKWEAMSGYQQTVTLSLFLDTFGTLLQSGVPIVQAMQTVAYLLPTASQEGWTKTIHCVYPTGDLFCPEMKRMGIFPDFAVEMTRIGEESGTLNSIFHRLAETFEDDLEYQIVPAARDQI
ncbi:MAG: Type secretory pathway, component PulF [Chthonomonadaceae bacterium]|nr:Type secretory pathway, component PulF [Chthonomonadaceae bacterium]